MIIMIPIVTTSIFFRTIQFSIDSQIIPKKKWVFFLICASSIQIQQSSQRQLDSHYQVDTLMWQWLIYVTPYLQRICEKVLLKCEKAVKYRDGIWRTGALPMAGSVDKVIKCWDRRITKLTKIWVNILTVHYSGRDLAQLTTMPLSEWRPAFNTAFATIIVYMDTAMLIGCLLRQN